MVNNCNSYLEREFIGIDIVDGTYKVVEQIGYGSFGFIYKVKHNKNGKLFAAKIEFGDC